MTYATTTKTRRSLASLLVSLMLLVASATPTASAAAKPLCQGSSCSV